MSSAAITAHAAEVANVDDARIIGNGKSGKEWLSNGLDYSVTASARSIRSATKKSARSGLPGANNLKSSRGVEATPLVVDGIMYVTVSWSVVHAIDVRTGQREWSF